MKKLLTIGISILGLSACTALDTVSSAIGSVGTSVGQSVTDNTSVSDSLLQRRAAFALNTTADRVRISNREKEGYTVHFVANVGKRAHQCYVTASAGVVSDAICSGSNSVRSSSNKTSEGNATCNALLKAANRC